MADRTATVTRNSLRLLSDIAALFGKHGNFVTKGTNKDLLKEGIDPGFKSRLDDLDSAISRRS